jgi:hypothetical protein
MEKAEPTSFEALLGPAKPLLRFHTGSTGKRAERKRVKKEPQKIQRQKKKPEKKFAPSNSAPVCPQAFVFHLGEVVTAAKTTQHLRGSKRQRKKKKEKKEKK